MRGTVDLIVVSNHQFASFVDLTGAIGLSHEDKVRRCVESVRQIRCISRDYRRGYSFRTRILPDVLPVLNILDRETLRTVILHDGITYGLRLSGC